MSAQPLSHVRALGTLSANQNRKRRVSRDWRLQQVSAHTFQMKGTVSLLTHSLPHSTHSTQFHLSFRCCWCAVLQLRLRALPAEPTGEFTGRSLRGAFTGRVILREAWRGVRKICFQGISSKSCNPTWSDVMVESGQKLQDELLSTIILGARSVQTPVSRQAFGRKHF